MKQKTWLTAVSAAALAFAISSNAQAQTPATAPAADDACTKLTGLHIDGVVIDSAGIQAASVPIPGARLPDVAGGPYAGPQISGVPAFCRVAGSIHPEAGSNIRFEVWLPKDGWDGRLVGGNNGGLAGSISYMDLASGVRAGQVVFSTDTGHTGGFADGAWAKGHPELVRDYGWRAIHVTTVTAKKILAAYYGRPQTHSYFIGCSNGGRQALIEASRFPEDYEGIVAGAPAAQATDSAMTKALVAQAQMPPGAALRPEQAKLLQSEVLEQCDAIDGQKDGLIADPRQCKFNTEKLACGVSSSPLCFTKPQLTALKQIYAGPHDSAGHRVAYGFPPSGGEVGIPIAFFGWDGSIMQGDQPKTNGEPLADAIMSELPATPIATARTFNFDKDPARLRAALAGDLNAQPDMQKFFAHGGKLIMWHGWADSTLPPEGTIAFYEQILSHSGPAAKDQLRFFMVPGVGHCGSGPGPNQLGQIGAPLPSDTPDRSLGAAIQAWVEHGRVPQNIIARRGTGGVTSAQASGPEKQRLICAYPERAVLQSGADPDQGASYTCKM